MLNALKETGKPIITIILTGRPLVLSEVAENSSALLISWFPGTEGGNGIADVLTGRQSPSGRLTMSFPRATGQVPIYYNHLPTGRPNTSNHYQPFANGYIDIQPGPLYPFGYGLTYTDFTYSGLSLSAKEVNYKNSSKEEECLIAGVILENTGQVTGTETVQLYLQDMAGTYSRPVRMLKGFQKVTLQPGEKQTVSFSITPKMLEYYIPGKGLSLEPGRFRVYIGPHAQTEEYQEFLLNGGY